MHARRGSQQPRAQHREERRDERAREEIVRLGKTYSLLTRETSFVAVETRDAPVTGEVVLRKVPVALTDGWHGFGGARLSRVGGAAHITGSGMAWGHRSMDSGVPIGGTPSFAPPVAMARYSMAPSAPRLSRGERAEASARESSSALRPLDRLIQLQRADGSWALSAELADIVGRSLAELERLLDDAVRGAHTSIGRRLAALVGADGARRQALATAFALRWLESSCADSRDEWTLLADKAKEWLGHTAEGAAFWRAAVEP